MAGGVGRLSAVGSRIAAMVKYAILGPIELTDGERLLPVGGPRQMSLLAFLLVHANRAVSTDRLINALWVRQSPADALKSLHVAISRLRKTLNIDRDDGEPALRTVATGYLLAVRPGELDAELFQKLVAEGRLALQAGEAKRGREVLHEALAMWRGPALAEVAYEEFAQPEIRRLEELRLAALEASVDARLQLGEHGMVIAELEALVASHPGRERLAGQLMLALYRWGRQGEALEVYAITREYLSRELGLEPGPALQTLQRQILTQSDELAGPEVPNILIPRTVAHSLPRPLRSHRRELPFIGRDQELERLQNSQPDTDIEARRVVVISGEAGIGKTRLAAEFAREVHGQGVLVMYGRCDEGLAVPYQPFVEALRPLANLAGSLPPALGRLWPDLTSAAGSVPTDPESERFALFEAVSVLLQNPTNDRRALLVLDDLHWAAAPTLLMLRHLIRAERPLGALLLATYREDELALGQPLAQFLVDLQGEACAERMSLRGIDESATAALVSSATGLAVDNHTDEFAHVLHSQTAGNPFFIYELIVHLVEAKNISATVRASGVRYAGGEFEVPEGLRHVIAQRVARLSKPAQRAVSCAAVAGSTFSLAVLERVLEDTCAVPDALYEAEAAGLVSDMGHGEYAFAHALVRQTLYRALGSARRIRLHRRFGEALERADIKSSVDALAYHFAQSASDGQAEKAADYALLAGREAVRRLGYEEAAAQYTRGLKALDHAATTNEQQRCELLLALGEVQWVRGEVDNAKRTCLQATELAEKLGDCTRLARAALGFAGPLLFETNRAVAQPIVEILERALSAIDEDDSGLRALVMARLAATLANVTVEERRPVLARQALEIARRVDDPAMLARVLAMKHYATRSPYIVEESLSTALELADLAAQIGDRRQEVEARVWVLDHQLELGDVEAVEQELTALQRLVDALQDRYSKWLFANVRARQAHLAGQLEDFEALAHEALAHSFQSQEETARHVFGGQMVALRREQGRLDEVVGIIEGFITQFPGVADVWSCALAYMYAELEQASQARGELQRLAKRGFNNLPQDALWSSSMAMLSEVVAFLGDAHLAAELYELLTPFAGRCVVNGVLCQGSVSRLLGLLAMTMSWYDQAERHYAAALELDVRIKSSLWEAHTRYNQASLKLRRGKADDREETVAILDQVLDAATRLGLEALGFRAQQLRQQALAG
jgi:DNA-binding SARP family transcriptional activator/predicted ATPase